MTGHDVRVLQDFLTLAGFPTPIAGVFGPVTERNVRAFERKYHLTLDGIVDGPFVREIRHVVGTSTTGTESDTSGGSSWTVGPTSTSKKVSTTTPAPPPPTGKTRINANGTATAPAGAPAAVVAVVAAANKIISKPYIYAGGHATWYAPGYDCSGAVSFALHFGGLLGSSEDSTGFESYGRPGPGKWITVYANAGHAFMTVAGRAFDTADFGGPNIPPGSGPRWRSNPTGNLADGTGGYVAVHPTGY
jgi:Putative peptidoglycan binding domain